MSEKSVTEVDAIWQAADPQLAETWPKRFARMCGMKFASPGCLTAITKSILFTLEEGRRAVMETYK